jgi:hypothetical protein
MLGYARATNPKFNEQRQRELASQYGSFRPAGSKPSQVPDLIRDMGRWGMGGSIHRGSSADGPVH